MARRSIAQTLALIAAAYGIGGGGLNDGIPRTGRKKHVLEPKEISIAPSLSRSSGHRTNPFAKAEKRQPTKRRGLSRKQRKARTAELLRKRRG